MLFSASLLGFGFIRRRRTVKGALQALRLLA
jgi:hypothetical protein